MGGWYLIKGTRPFTGGSHQICLAIWGSFVLHIALRKMTEDWRAPLDRRGCWFEQGIRFHLPSTFVSQIESVRFYRWCFGTYGCLSFRKKTKRVQVKGVYSQRRAINAGVSQGSLLAPLLFNLYVNDLNYFVSNTSLRLYADDRTEYAFEPSPMVLQYVINSDLSVLSTRFEPNYVKIDAPKTQALAIGPSIWIWLSF